ncbi:hypothetical protein SDC9_96130 [bioreactor metagenome]|uniref:Uncharacterized protein n=1 Tax=bioreactor metagenome TaxID=1076179 RepID=A0A645AAS9_9ZZZZ
MLGINKCGYTSFFLCFCNGMDGQSRLPGAFRSIYLNYTSTRKTSDADGKINSDAAGRNGLKFFDGVVTQFHNCTFSVGLFNPLNGHLKRFQFLGIHRIFFFFLFAHIILF